MAEIGGFESLRVQYMNAVPNSTLEAMAYSNFSNTSQCGIPTDNAWQIFRAADAGDYPWPGVVFGIFLLSAQYFCTNQVNLTLQIKIRVESPFWKFPYFRYKMKSIFIGIDDEATL